MAKGAHRYEGEPISTNRLWEWPDNVHWMCSKGLCGIEKHASSSPIMLPEGVLTFRHNAQVFTYVVTPKYKVGQ